MVGPDGPGADLKQGHAVMIRAWRLTLVLVPGLVLEAAGATGGARGVHRW